MRKFFLLGSVFIALLLSGCSSSQPVAKAVKKVQTSEMFRIESIFLSLNESKGSKIQYHTREELEQLLQKRLHKILEEKGLLSSDIAMNSLKIDTQYFRTFLGDATPLSSDSLRYPFYEYAISVLDEKNIITKVEKKNLTYKGGFLMNLQVLAGGLRDKKYELEFIEALASRIVQEIVDLKERGAH